MQFKKQFWGYNCQQVGGFLAATERQEQEELNKISARINACQQKNQKRIADLDILLQQIEAYRDDEQKITDQILEQVRKLEAFRSQADQKIVTAQKELAIKLDELSNSYNIIEDVKAKLATSHKQLAVLKQSESLASLHSETSRREF